MTSLLIAALFILAAQDEGAGTLIDSGHGYRIDLPRLPDLAAGASARLVSFSAPMSKKFEPSMSVSVFNDAVTREVHKNKMLQAFSAMGVTLRGRKDFEQEGRPGWQIEYTGRVGQHAVAGMLVGIFEEDRYFEWIVTTAQTGWRKDSKPFLASLQTLTFKVVKSGKEGWYCNTQFRFGFQVPDTGVPPKNSQIMVSTFGMPASGTFIESVSVMLQTVKTTAEKQMKDVEAQLRAEGMRVTKAEQFKAGEVGAIYMEYVAKFGPKELRFVAVWLVASDTVTIATGAIDAANWDALSKDFIRVVRSLTPVK